MEESMVSEDEQSDTDSLQSDDEDEEMDEEFLDDDEEVVDVLGDVTIDIRLERRTCLRIFAAHPDFVDNLVTETHTASLITRQGVITNIQITGLHERVLAFVMGLTHYMQAFVPDNENANAGFAVVNLIPEVTVNLLYLAICRE
jgi:hypothetical protein